MQFTVADMRSWIADVLSVERWEHVLRWNRTDESYANDVYTFPRFPAQHRIVCN